jgi:hypothetical protein
MKRNRTDHGMNSPPATTTAQHAAQKGDIGVNYFDTGQGGGHLQHHVELGNTSG